VEHAVLYGEYELQVDEKNRLLIPAEIRKQLSPERDGEAFFLVVGTERKIWFLPERLYYAYSHQSPGSMTPSADALRFNRAYFANAAKAEWDKQGRLVVPERLLQRTNTGREVTLIGIGDRLELWNRSEWEAQLKTII
jgi:MraZ protein